MIPIPYYEMKALAALRQLKAHPGDHYWTAELSRHVKCLMHCGYYRLASVRYRDEECRVLDRLVEAMREAGMGQDWVHTPCVETPSSGVPATG